MPRQRALIIDDEPDIRELLEITLMRMGLDTDSAESITQAKQRVQENDYQLCLTDMNLPDGNGIDFVSHIQRNHPHIPIAMITAYGSVETAISALKAGAFDFISKPVDLGQLRELVNTALKLSKPAAPESDSGSRAMLGQSDKIVHLTRQIAKLARSQAPVYIAGESGSGKELVARMIHQQGPRNNAPFVPVNCGAIPAELMESEFFGHKKGSFTGAIEDKEGLFRAANGGTLFLDEVADLPLPMQVKLLRAIQEKSVRPVGEQHEIAIDVRVLSATHKNLQNLVDSGEFRQDLFYRINVIQVDVPSLRERQQDIPLLALHFLDKISAECNISDAKFSDGAMEALKNYSFPGNVRELENIIERAFTLCENDTIEAHDLQLRGDHLNSEDTPAEIKTDPLASTAAAETTEGAIPEQRAPDTSLEDFLESIERQTIEKALEETRWNKTAAAKKLGISFRALRYRLKKLNME